MADDTEDTKRNLGLTIAVSGVHAQIIPNYHPATAPQGVRGCRIVLRRPSDNAIILYGDAFYRPDGVPLPHYHPWGSSKGHTNIAMEGHKTSYDALADWMKGETGLGVVNKLLGELDMAPLASNHMAVIAARAATLVSFQSLLVEE